MRLGMRSMEITRGKSSAVFFQLNRVWPGSILQACFNPMKTASRDSGGCVLQNGQHLVGCP